jgi:predicted lipoprotein with Yx(FWY)xxD motif
LRRLFLLVLACGLLAGCSAGKPGAAKPVVAPVPRVTLQVGRILGHPAVLVDQRGYTLYVSRHEAAGRQTCTGNCLEIWPLVLLRPGASVETEPGAVERAAVTTVPVAGGRAVAYHGYLLHTYVGDEGPGGNTGQGLDGQWSTITPAGRPTA